MSPKNDIVFVFYLFGGKGSENRRRRLDGVVEGKIGPRLEREYI